MPKFKVGDRVELVSPSFSWSGKKGTIVEIGIMYEYPYCVKYDEPIGYQTYGDFSWESLKLIENDGNQCSNDVHEFKNGDQVIVDCETLNCHNKIGIIVGGTDCFPKVKFPNEGLIITFNKRFLKPVQTTNTNEHIINITQSLEKLREENQRYREQLAYVVGQLSQHVDKCSCDVTSDLKDYYKVGRDSERWLQQRLASGCLSFDEYKETRKNQINKILQVLNK